MRYWSQSWACSSALFFMMCLLAMMGITSLAGCRTPYEDNQTQTSSALPPGAVQPTPTPTAPVPAPSPTGNPYAAFDGNWATLALGAGCTSNNNRLGATISGSGSTFRLLIDQYQFSACSGLAIEWNS